MAKDPSSRVPWREVLHPRYLKDPTTLLLLAVNLIPLFGVFLLGWDILLLLLLYWMESAVIGFWHILRLGMETRWFSLFLVPFFTAHYGGFMTGHFVFIGALFGGPQWAPIRSVGDFLDKILVGTGLWIPLLALFLSHGFSFFRNYLRRFPSLREPGAPARASLAAGMEGLRSPKAFAPLMTAPYARIVVMHLTIILGGFLVQVLQWRQAAIVLMVFLKIAVDLGCHVRKNFRKAPGSSTAGPASAPPAAPPGL